MSKRTFLFIVAGCWMSGLLHAADCDAIKSLKLPDTTITMAEKVSDGVVQGPTIARPIGNLPLFCRVTGELRPTADSDIEFEVWMPENDWNGRFLGVGNGGFAGSIDYRQLAGGLHRGFAVAASDAGHKAEAEDASWAFGHKEKIKDFGWRAVHWMTERAREIVSSYYGKAPDKSYFDACSDGGREALMEAERFPEDYNGILAGAPANAWTSMLSGGLATEQSTLSDPRRYFSSMKLPAIEQASLAACDAQDGVKDGIISDPAKCNFDPEVLRCKAADKLDCLTEPQVTALKAFYGGGKDGQGKRIFPGFTMGDEKGWADWVIGHGPGSGAGVHYLQNYFRYMVTSDPKWNALTADVDRSMAMAIEKTSADIDATNPDLSRFQARGGKLILYHGWNDPAISPWNTIDYYTSVQKQMGSSQADAFLRLYMAPGVEHCAGGPGPDAFGQFGLATAKGPRFGLFDALEEWVEKGVPAGDVVATKYEADSTGAMKVKMTRPLCPYPTAAKFKGTGDANDSANFVCAAE